MPAADPRFSLSDAAPVAPRRAGLDVGALLSLGYAAAARGERARAAAMLDRVARERPDQPHPCAGLACALPKVPRSRIDAQFQCSLRLAPDDPRLCEAYADFLIDGGESDKAEPVLQAWLRQHPGSAAAQTTAGIAYTELGRFDRALAYLRQAVNLAPDQAICWANLGMVLKIIGAFQPALEAYAAAIARDPTNPRIRVNRTVALLHAGRWQEAWRDYEYRLLLPAPQRAPSERLLPDLAQAGSLRGRTVLVTHEDGFGDTIQFARFIPLLAERGARVLLWLPDALYRLMERLPGVAELLTGNMPMPAHDYICPVLSLPRAFAATPETVPRAPYLTADPALAAAWAARLPSGGMRVGLVWRGQSRPWVPGFAGLDGRRSARLADFAPLAEVPGVRFVSLQVGAAAAEAAEPPAGMDLRDPTPSLSDFAETAAVVANLDLVVSVDTAVLHLAGAMGKPAFLLDRYDNCWRWLSGRADSPWYPSLTIFRQTRPGSWAEPVRRATAALEAMALYHGTTPPPAVPPLRGSRKPAAASLEMPLQRAHLHR